MLRGCSVVADDENTHITVRPPMWWKGFIDSISIKFPQISTMLFCSTEYNTLNFSKFGTLLILMKKKNTL